MSKLKLLQELKKMEMDQKLYESVQLVQGKDGYTPVKGVDYFTEEEIKQIINFIQSSVKNGEKGEKGDQGEPGKAGKNGRTPVKGVDYWTEADKNLIISEVSKNIKNGKDGVSPKIEDIINAVIEKISTPEMMKNYISKEELANFLRRGGFRGGGDTIVAGTNITTTIDGLGRKVINASGGSGGSNVETPTGTVNGSNTTFTVVNTPKWIIVDGMTRFETVNYTYLAGTITITDGNPPINYIRSIY